MLNTLKINDLTHIFGQKNAKLQLASALLMRRHVVVFGPPGIGKTTLAKNLADLLPTIKVNDCGFNCLPKEPVCPSCKKRAGKTITLKGRDRFVRVQGSPDLTAEDLLGDIDPIKAMKYGATSIEAFTPGKIFRANNGVLFFDELNRCPEKLQNALLQVLEERRATIGSYDIDIKANFIFIATMNPHDTNTERLSDVLLDRFDVIYMDYPENLKIEKEIVKEKGKELSKVSESLMDLMMGFIRYLREDDRLEKVPSVRASIGLYERAQANARLRDRKSVNFSDVKDSVVSVLAHRIRLKPSLKYVEDPGEFLQKGFEKYVDENFSDRLSSEKGGDG